MHILGQNKQKVALQERNNVWEKPENSLPFFYLAGVCVSELEGKKEGIQVLIGHLLGIFEKDVSWEGLRSSLCISRVWMSTCTSLAHFCAVSKTHMMQKRFTKR